MNKKEKIEQEIEKTLAQFDQKEILPPNPYFLTRVQQRIKTKNSQRGVFSTVLRPAALVVLIVLNLSTALWYFNSTEQNLTSDSREDLIELLSADLSLGTNQSDISILE